MNLGLGSDILRLDLRSIENPATPITMQQLAEIYDGTPAAAGVRVNDDQAGRVSTWLGCRRVHTEDFATTPCHLYERTAKGNQRADGHPLQLIVHDEPNEFMTDFAMREAMEGHIFGRGNTLGLILFGEDGRANGIVPVPSGSWWYEYKPGVSLWYFVRDGDGELRRLDPSEVVHVPGIGGDGVGGFSPLGWYAKDVLGSAIAIENHAAAFFAHGATFGGYVSAVGAINDKQWKRTEDFLNREHTGFDSQNRSRQWKLLMLDGFKYETGGIPPQQAQLLEHSQLKGVQICQITRTSPHLVALSTKDSQTYANVEQRSLEHVIHTMLPKYRRWQLEYNRKLFLRSERGRFFVEFSPEAFLRGDIETRSKYYERGIRNKWLVPNEPRRLENMPPLPGGDEVVGNPGPAPKDDGDDGDRGSTGSPRRALEPLCRDLAERIGRRQSKAIGRLRKVMGSEQWDRECSAVIEDVRSAAARAARPLAEAAEALGVASGAPQEVAGRLGDALAVTIRETLRLACKDNDPTTFDAVTAAFEREASGMIARRTSEAVLGEEMAA